MEVARTAQIDLVDGGGVFGLGGRFRGTCAAPLDRVGGPARSASGWPEWRLSVLRSGGPLPTQEERLDCVVKRPVYVIYRDRLDEAMMCRATVARARPLGNRTLGAQGFPSNTVEARDRGPRRRSGSCSSFSCRMLQIDPEAPILLLSSRAQAACLSPTCRPEARWYPGRVRGWGADRATNAGRRPSHLRAFFILSPI